MPALSSGSEAAASQPSAAELIAHAAREPASVAGHRLLLREDVYARLHAWIVNGLLPPGTVLRDKEIAEALQVSRTPVREAIRRLQDEGLVVAEASRWTKVAPLDAAMADRVYPIVWTLERLAITLSGARAVPRLSALRAANARLAEALRERDPVRASQADTDFHHVILETAANPELASIVGDLKVAIRRLEVAFFGGTITGERSVEEHQRVIAALESGDLAVAGAEIERNWRISLDHLHQRQAQRKQAP